MRILCAKGLFFVLILLSLSGNLFAQEEEFREYIFPEIGPKIDLKAGYSIIELKGTGRVEEYEYLQDSPYLSGEVIYFSFPYRLNIDLELKNKKDYYGDMSLSFKDIIFFRSISRSIFHNLENIIPFAFDPVAGLPSTYIGDPGEVYGIKSAIHSLYLRFKTPDYPFHVYLDGRLIDREGISQQTGLIGSGYFNSLVVKTRKREIDWILKEVSIGTNSHLGPVEIELSHGENRFDIKKDNLFYDFYSPSGFSSPFMRDAGIFPHNLIPEIKGSSDAIKIHTSYTGGIVVSASAFRIEKDNKDSGSKVEYVIGSSEIMWMPTPRFTLFLKYRHKERDIDNPSSVSITDISNPANSYTYLLKDAISSTSDIVSGILRYRPFKGLTLRVEYTIDNIRRDFAEIWELPSTTEKGNLTISADIKPHRTLNVKARYIHKETDNPAYNYEPEKADEGRLSLTWTPVNRINAFFSYAVSRERSNDIYVKNTDSFWERDVKRDRITGTITFLFIDNLSLSATYSYIHNRTIQDIAVKTATPPYNPLRDSLVPYKDLVRNYSIDINFEPKNNISLSSGLNYTLSRGIFYPSIPELSEPESVSSLSELKVRETVYTLNGEYRIKGGVSLGLRYRYTSLRDLIDNPYDDISNGRSHIILFTVTKSWR